MKPTVDQILKSGLDSIHEAISLEATADSTASSLTLDSLDMIDTVIFIEDDLGISIPDEATVFTPDMTLRQCAEKIHQHLPD